METTITQETRSELINLVRAEMEHQERERRDNRSMYHRVCMDFEADMARFDYMEQQRLVDANGKVHIYSNSRLMHWKVRDAIGTLLRAIYQTDAIAKLPVDKEPEIRDFIGSVLALMQQKGAEK